MADRRTVKKIIDIYRGAWVNRNPDKILTIFTKNAVYHERVLEKPHIGHKQIRKYWVDKVIGEQEKIKFRLLNLYMCGKTAVAEWDVNFFNKKKGKKIHMREVALLEIKGNKISSLREYWHAAPKS